MIDKKKTGVSLVELLIVASITALMLGIGCMMFSTGQATWFTADVNIQLQESLRQTLDKVAIELRQTKTSQQQVIDGGGWNNTDIIRFSIPVICEAGGNLLDASGDVAYWRAPLVWGCTDSSCMDADNDCATIDYKFIEFQVNKKKQLVRRVINNENIIVAVDVFVRNISDFQVTFNAGVINLQVEAQVTAINGRILTADTSTNIYLRN